MALWRGPYVFNPRQINPTAGSSTTAEITNAKNRTISFIAWLLSKPHNNDSAFYSCKPWNWSRLAHRFICNALTWT